MPKQKYEDKTDKKNKLLEELPDFARLYLKHFSVTASINSVYGYTYDLTIFFRFLIESNPLFKNRKTSEFLPSEMEQLRPADFDEYVSYIQDLGSGASAIKRKLAAIHGMYEYMQVREMISSDPSRAVRVPYKEKSKEILFLTSDEISSLLDYIKTCEGTGRQKEKQEKDRVRDYAITALLLGTGMRVSELAGIDLDNIDFRNSSVSILRKGGSRQSVYFSDTVADALTEYIMERENINGADEDAKKALFLSSQRKRITTRTVENIICRYAAAVVPYKHITPHKLRSTFATHVLHNSHDIALVSTMLNHADVSTTKKYYSKVLDEDIMDAARNKAPL